jgi:hypothetical protein
MSYPNSVCDVVTDPYQFSWYNDSPLKDVPDPLDWLYFIEEYIASDHIEMKAWLEILDMAFYHLIEREGGDQTNNALHYMTVPHFAQDRGMRPFNNTYVVGVNGKHIFFAKCKRRNPCLNF